MNGSGVAIVGEGGNSTNGNVLMSAEGYVASAIALFLTGFFGFVFNILVIILMWKDKQLWTPLNVVIFNLVCSDFSISILGNPWTFLSALARKWIFGRVMCKAYGFFMSLLGITSITTLTVLAFERYMMVLQPIQRKSLSIRGSYFLILCIWCYSSLLTTPPLIGWGDYVNEAANISCSVNWEERSLNNRAYIIYLFIFGLFVPITVIVFSYTNIILAMTQNKLKMGKVKKVEKQVTLMILVMIVTFLLAWCPYAVMSLIIQFGSFPEVTPASAVIPAIIAKTSICYNPVIYVGLNAQFRQSWRQMFTSESQYEKSVVENTNARNASPSTQDFSSLVCTRKTQVIQNLKTSQGESLPLTETGEAMSQLDGTRTGRAEKFAKIMRKQECSRV